MKKLFNRFAKLLAIVTVVAVSSVAMLSTPTLAASASSEILSGANATGAQTGNPTNVSSIIETTINILLFAVGILSVIMIIYAGIRYVTSAGNSQSVSAAKNTLIYSIVGLVIAIVAYALVDWVFTTIK